MIDNYYQDIHPPFNKVERIDLAMTKEMKLEEFFGYLSTWSALNNYKIANPTKEDPSIDLCRK